MDKNSFEHKYIKYKTKYHRLKYRNMTNRIEPEITEALEINKWIELAEQKDLLLKPSDYKNLEQNKEYEAVEVDYLGFLFRQYGKEFGLIENKIYSSQEAYNKIKSVIVPLGKVKSSKAPVIQTDCCTAKMETVDYFRITLYSFKWPGQINQDNKPHEADLYKVSNSKWLASGSGDGHSRWMLWNNLKLMPNIFFKRY